MHGPSQGIREGGKPTEHTSKSRPKKKTWKESVSCQREGQEIVSLWHKRNAKKGTRKVRQKGGSERYLVTDGKIKFDALKTETRVRTDWLLNQVGPGRGRGTP